MTTGSASFQLSVVVPTRNRAERVLACLDPLLTDPATAEVVVIDDGSTDATPRVLADRGASEPRLRVLRRTGRGASHARQAGLEAATGDVVLFVDDDIVAEPGLAGGHLAHHRAAKSKLVVLGYMPTVRPPGAQAGRFATTLYAEEYERHVEGWEQDPETILPGLWSGNFSLPRGLALAAGMVTPGAEDIYHEDRDFGLRLEAQGATAVFDRSLLAHHAHHRSLDQFLADSYRQGRGRVIVHERHPHLGPPDPDRFADGLPRPVRLLVLATDRRWLRRGMLGLGRAVIAASNRARVPRAELLVARMLRRVEQRRGAVERLAERSEPAAR